MESQESPSELSPASPESKVLFTNAPLLSKHEIDASHNEKRLSLAREIGPFVAAHPLFKDREVNVTFSHDGVSSLVSILETPEEKAVLKIPLANSKQEGEGMFLNQWESAGVSVPHVVEEGLIADSPYLLMKHIDAPTLRQKNGYKEMVENEVFIKMGQTLRLMHTPEAKGFGRIKNGEAQYESFDQWLDSDDIQKRMVYAREHNLLGDKYGSIEKALEVLRDYVHGDNKSRYCHNDFSPYNIFATDPITVFDPDPVLNHAYIDLGRSISIAAGHGGIDAAADQLITGYFNGEPFDEQALQASVLLSSYIKFKYWHKTKKASNMKNLEEYLRTHTGLLER